MSPKQCANCRFWVAPHSPMASTGTCRRYPPERTPGPLHTVRTWPDVYRFDWCGEWQAAEVSDAD